MRIIDDHNNRMEGNANEQITVSIRSTNTNDFGVVYKLGNDEAKRLEQGENITFTLVEDVRLDLDFFFRDLAGPIVKYVIRVKGDQEPNQEDADIVRQGANEVTSVFYRFLVKK